MFIFVPVDVDDAEGARPSLTGLVAALCVAVFTLAGLGASTPFMPGPGGPFGWLTSGWVAAGPVSLIGTVLFLSLSLGSLERAGGSAVAAGTLVAGTLVFALVHALLESSLAGPAGAVAASLGALTARYPSVPIRFLNLLPGASRSPRAWTWPQETWAFVWLAFGWFHFLTSPWSGIATPLAHLVAFLGGAAVSFLASRRRHLKGLAVEGATSAALPTALGSASTLRRRPPHPALAIAEAAARRGDDAAALLAYDDVLVSDPENVDAHFGIAMLELLAGRREEGTRRAGRVLMRLGAAGEHEEAARMLRALLPDFDPKLLGPVSAFEIADIAARYEDLRPLLEPLLLTAAEGSGERAARALLRAAELRIAQKDGLVAFDYLQRISSTTASLSWSEALKARRFELENQARRLNGEVAFELRTLPSTQAPAGEDAQRVAPRIFPCRLLHLGPQVLEVELEQGDRKTIPLERIVAVAAGVAPDQEEEHPRNLLVTDVILSWGAPNVGPLVMRLTSHGLRLGELFPGMSPRAAYVRLLEQLLDKTGAAALPDRRRLRSGEFPVYENLAALEANYYPRA